MTQPEKPAEPQYPKHDEHAARDLVAELAYAALEEKRRSRRWGIFFKALFFVYLVVIFALVYTPLDQETPGTGKRHTALVSIEGIIATGADASAENIIDGLRTAFENSNSVGVILHINSPGGSPVQAGRVYDEIKRLRTTYPDKPVYAVAADVCASGGYYIATAAQNIYANQASIIGSIGVRADGFGFVQAIDKLGVTRRLYTAGERKGFLDPFLPPQPYEIQHIENILDEIHQQFITAVRQGRGERLQNDPQLFSGLVWTGTQSIDLGLIDALADVRYVAEEIIDAEDIVDYTKRPRFFEQFFNGLESRLNAILLRLSTGHTPTLLP